VSLELDPTLMHDATNTVAEVRHLEAQINRANVMVEVPATPAGIEAVKTLTRDGVSLNITHVFSVDVYERVAQAYIEGLEVFLDTHSVWRFTPTSVVSFSVSAIDEAVDPLLAERGEADLLGRTAVAQARQLVGRCQSIFSGPRWQKLARRGGRILRPKWSRTTPRNPAYADTCYIEALICPHTVTTFSLQTLAAFQEHGRVESHTASWAEQAEAHLRRVAELGLDMDTIAANLQQEYLRASEHQFQAITRRISRKREELERAWQRTATHGTAVHPAVMTELPTQNPVVR
jgi:transaldolase